MVDLHRTFNLVQMLDDMVDIRADVRDGIVTPVASYVAQYSTTQSAPVECPWSALAPILAGLHREIGELQSLMATKTSRPTDEAFEAELRNLKQLLPVAIRRDQSGDGVLDPSLLKHHLPPFLCYGP